MGERNLKMRDFEIPALLMMGLAGAGLTYFVFQYYSDAGVLVGDGHAYWLTGQDGYQPYEIAPNHRDAFLYSPAFAHAISPLARLPWPVFAIVWVAAEAAAFVWLLRPLGWAWTVVLLLWCSPELVIGNILGFMAVALVLGLGRWPGAWALPILTKPVFGIGVLWFAVRGEWRRFGSAIAVTVTAFAVSFLLDQGMWSSWAQFLLSSAQEDKGALPARVLMAIGLVVFAAKTDRRWLVPVALLVCTPVFAGSPSLTILAAIPRLLPVSQMPTRSRSWRTRHPDPPSMATSWLDSAT